MDWPKPADLVPPKPFKSVATLILMDVMPPKYHVWSRTRISVIVIAANIRDAVV